MNYYYKKVKLEMKCMIKYIQNEQSDNIQKNVFMQKNLSKKLQKLTLILDHFILAKFQSIVKNSNHSKH